VGKTDLIQFHAVLSNDGTDVYEIKGNPTSPPEIVSTTVFSWQDDTMKATVKMLGQNIGAMTEAIYDSLLVNDKLVDFWSKLKKSYIRT